MYDPTTGKVSPAGSMNTARETGIAITLQDGRVRAVGGVNGSDPGPLTSAELYQP
jgi:hypothetical protein